MPTRCPPLILQMDEGQMVATPNQVRVPLCPTVATMGQSGVLGNGNMGLCGWGYLEAVGDGEEVVEEDGIAVDSKQGEQPGQAGQDQHHQRCLQPRAGGERCQHHGVLWDRIPMGPCCGAVLHMGTSATCAPCPLCPHLTHLVPFFSKPWEVAQDALAVSTRKKTPTYRAGSEGELPWGPFPISPPHPITSLHLIYPIDPKHAPMPRISHTLHIVYGLCISHMSHVPYTSPTA